MIDKIVAMIIMTMFGSLSTLSLIALDAVPDPEPVERPPGREELGLELRSFADDDLGSGSPELSGVTINESRNRLVVVVDSDQLIEFDLASDGTVVRPPRRVVPITTGGGDIEGISWLSGDRYAAIAENTGVVLVFDLDESQVEVGSADLVNSIQTTIWEDRGSGLEGVAVDRLDTDDWENEGSAVWVTFEAPPRLYRFSPDDELLDEVALDTPEIGLADVSDVWAGDDGTVWVISDESHAIVQLSIDGSAASVLGRHDLPPAPGGFDQAEGFAMLRDGTRAWVVGEVPGDGYWTFAVFDRAA